MCSFISTQTVCQHTVNLVYPVYSIRITSKFDLQINICVEKVHDILYFANFLELLLVPNERKNIRRECFNHQNSKEN